MLSRDHLRSERGIVGSRCRASELRRPADSNMRAFSLELEDSVQVVVGRLVFDIVVIAIERHCQESI